MATPEQRQEKIKTARKLLAQLAEINATSHSRTDDLLRDINFSEAVPYFEEMLDLVKQLNQRNIERLASTHLQNIIGGCNQLTQFINSVNEFDLNQNTPADVCKGIIDQIKNGYDSVMEPLTIPLAFTATQATDYAKIEREAKGYHTTMKEEVENFKGTMKSYKVEAEKALLAVKEQAAEAGVSTNAQIFLTDSSAHAMVAKNWLTATVWATAITLLPLENIFKQRFLLWK